MKPGTTRKLKFVKLRARLKLADWQAVGILEAIWQATYDNAPHGDIGRLSDEDIATAIGWCDAPSLLIEPLVECRWIDRDPIHRLLIHDWEEHCASWLKANFARHKKEFAKPTSQSTQQLAAEVTQQLAAVAAGQATAETAGEPPMRLPPTQTCPDQNPSSPSPSPSSPAPNGATPKSNPFDEEVEVVNFILDLRRAKSFVAPSKIEVAVHQAVAAGCSIDQLRDRASWFSHRLGWWSEEHRPGALHDGLAAATPDMAIDEGWPHVAGRVASEREDAARAAKELEVAARRERVRPLRETNGAAH